MSVTKKEIRIHLLNPIERQEGQDYITDVLALWCQGWEIKLRKMSMEERKDFLKKKRPNSSWHYITEIIEEKEKSKGRDTI